MQLTKKIVPNVCQCSCQILRKSTQHKLTCCGSLVTCLNNECGYFKIFTAINGDYNCPNTVCSVKFQRNQGRASFHWRRLKKWVNVSINNNRRRQILQIKQRINKTLLKLKQLHRTMTKTAKFTLYISCHEGHRLGTVNCQVIQNLRT